LFASAALADPWDKSTPIRGVTVGPIESSLHPGKGYGSPACARTVAELARMGATWVSVTPYGRVWNLAPTGIDWTFEARFAEGRIERLPALAAQFVKMKVDVIVTGGTMAAQAAKRATTSIPIVMATGADQVGLGIVAGLARPGGSITGITSLAAELSGKRLKTGRADEEIAGRRNHHIGDRAMSDDEIRDI